ncbi:hypothetical protein DYB32_009576 [Aphanomyces invadans]|uniref:Uncharacterized protein n=1 Tax=Aphanomyces invadans TaxID=157072 RepID=A0A418AHU0_9STRA|nr:hypothetical protein DYB32_009576 [Aphanomyces invadans]
MKKFAKKGGAGAAAVNDDELEQNWAPESVEVDSNTSDVEVEDDDEADEDGEVEEVQDDKATKKRGRDDGTDEGGKPAKTNKKHKSTKGLQNMTQTEHFKLVNEVYSKLYGDKLTPVEIANGLTEAHFTVVPQFGKHNLDSLSRFLRSICPKWKLLFKGKGIKGDCSPILVILCSSALRAVEVGKAIAVFHCHVAKLFGKHFKLTEQVEMLKRFHPIAIGTSSHHTTFPVLTSDDGQLKDTAKDTIDIIRDHMLVPLATEKLSIALY